jgi:O-phospho-L-seryl-tRNASec:L-selenocysteinyl-tRNA synthase
MDSFQNALESVVRGTYVKQGIQNRQSRQRIFNTLMINKRLPYTGLSDQIIQFIISELSNLDSNNFLFNIGVGEREGRVFSKIVADRNFNLSHGIGRSGNIIEVQPKAAGSSALYKLTTSLVLHALQIAGFTHKINCIIFPLATGMTLSLCMTALKCQNTAAKYVIWSRIDQKSCFKSILSAGLIPLIVDTIMENDELITDLDSIKALLVLHKGEVLCVLSTTSCFAPRQPDLVDQIAVMCGEHNVSHIINNAYGVQCKLIVKLLNRAMLKGRVDAGRHFFFCFPQFLSHFDCCAVIQSTDKNFLVPVGGAIVISTRETFLHNLYEIYPGRASLAPILDLFLTLLSMGEEGYSNLLNERQRILPLFIQGLSAVAQRFDSEILMSKSNSISVAVNIDNCTSSCDSVTFLGSMLFLRNVSGCRVVSVRDSQVTSISGFKFVNWGSHSSCFANSYFTAACAIGIKENEILEFLERLTKVFTLHKSC